MCAPVDKSKLAKLHRDQAQGILHLRCRWRFAVFNQRRRSGIRRLLGVLFLSSLTLLLVVGTFPRLLSRQD